MLVYLIIIVVAYLLGNISTSYIVAKRLAGVDIRTQGSGNAGSTNVLRTMGKKAGALTFGGDVLKGVVAVGFARILAYYMKSDQVTCAYIAVVAVVIGHNWPAFLGFKGGKGVATAFGAIAPIGWDLTGVMAGTWLLTVLLSGYSSLGAIVSALIAPFYVWWFKPQFTFPVSMLSCLILLRHHDNIQRLWRRQETKIWTKFKRKREKDPE